LTASCGIAPNKFLAKLASDSCKPDGLLVVKPDEVDSFLCPMPVGKLWGVGKGGEEALRRFGIVTVGDLREWPLEWLTERFGKWGAQIFNLARGIDDEP
ncbi:MAG: DNA polymerase IV, partial [Firmicutes bacterium]|nr:DNA polymerase IV [Bacillota bacterium]